MIMTREEAIRNFREHWASLAITGFGIDKKRDYLDRHGYPELLNHCFLCEYVCEYSGIEFDCKHCPIKWPIAENRSVSCPCEASIYGSWNQCYNADERKKLAAMIRDLPESEKVEETYKIGDWVKVLNDLYSFSTYDTFFTENGLDELKDRFAHKNPKNNAIYKIIAIGKHSNPESEYGPIYVLKPQDSDELYLMHNKYDSKPYLSFELTEPPNLVPKYKPGDMVVPVSKTVPGYEKYDIGSETNWSKSKSRGYFYVTGIDERETCINDKIVYCCFSENIANEGNYFFETDLIPYVKPQKTLSDFKVGDRVMVIGGDHASNKHIGKVATVRSLKAPSGSTVGIEFDEKVCDGHSLFNSRDGVRCKDGYGYWHYPRYLEHYVDPVGSKIKFAVGDKVVPVSKSSGMTFEDWNKLTNEFFKYFKEHGYLIVSEIRNEYLVCGTEISSGDYFLESDLVKYVEPKHEPSYGFKVGDRVRAINESHGWGSVKKGEIGVVTKPCLTDPYEGAIEVNFESQKQWVGNPECFELLPKNHCPKEKTITEQSVASYTFKGNETTCVIERGGKQFKGVAHCSPSDEWNEDVGRKLSKLRAQQAIKEADLLGNHA